MGLVISNLSMSLDGFIEDADGSVDRLFEWYTAGPVETESANADIRYRQSAEDTEHFQEAVKGIGALIAGRRLFDVTGGWNGAHPTGVPVFVGDTSDSDTAGMAAPGRAVHVRHRWRGQRRRSGEGCGR